MKKRITAALIAIFMLIPLAASIAADAGEITIPGAAVSASVDKLSGNKNQLTITVTDADGVKEATFEIDNNAEGVYTVGDAALGQFQYSVYVNTKGNTQVRACYFVDFTVPELVSLAQDSLGIAGDGMISGLPIGCYYIVEVGAADPVAMYVTKDGTLTADPDQLALLTVSEITGLTNGLTYKVTGSAEYPVINAADREMLDQIDAICQKYLYTGYTSMAVSVVKEGRIFFFNYGTAQSGSDPGYGDPASRTPVDEGSVYEIASLSKPFAAVLLAYFDQEGWLSMRDPISKYFPLLPDYVDSQGNHYAPTLEDLSAHTSGFPRMPRNWTDSVNPYVDYDRALLEDELANMVYDYKPGTTNSYSNLGVGVLGNILVDVYYGPGYAAGNGISYGQAYSNLLVELISQPLGMASTMVIADEDVTARKTLPHNAVGSKAYEWDFDALAGCGGIKSTSRDLALWLAANIGDYTPDDGLATAFAETFIPRNNLDNMGRSFNGLGWMVQPNRPYRVGYTPPVPNAGQRYGTLLYHNGAVGGYSTEYMACPETRSGVVCLMNNAGQAGLVDPLCAEIMDIVLSGNPQGSTDTAVKLTGDSLGTAGDRQITGLEPGKYYTLEIKTTNSAAEIATYLFTTSAGIVTDDPTQAGPLTGSVITHADGTGGIRLLNGQTYRVTGSDTPPAGVKNYEDAVDAMARPISGRFTGMVVGYFNDYTQGTLSYGTLESDQDGVLPKTPVTDDTLFELGAFSQTFTATLYSYLAENGIISPDETIADYFPEAKPYENGLWPTLGQMATSRSGLPVWPASFDDPAAYTRADLEADLAGLEYAAAPGQNGYSDFSMGLLCIIMTDAYNAHFDTELDYNGVLDAVILQPLGLQSTAVGGLGLLNDTALPHDAAGNPADYWDFGILGGHVAVHSTGADMTAWFRAYVEALRAPQEAGTLMSAIKATQSGGGNTIFRLNSNGTYYWYNAWSNGFNMTFIIHAPTFAGCTIIGNNRDTAYTFDSLANRIVTSALSPRNVNWV